MSAYRHLLRYALPYWRGWILIVLVTLLSTAFGLLQPWPMKVLVDNVLGGQKFDPTIAAFADSLPGSATPRGILLWVVIAGLVVFAVNSAIDVVLTFAWIRVGQRMVYDLAADLFARIQRRSLLFHVRNSVGDSMARVTGDSWSVHTVVDSLLFSPLHAVITLAGVLGVMLRMDAALTLVSLAVAPVMVASSLVFGRPIRRVGRLRRDLEGQIQAHVQRTLGGIVAVQAFGQETRELDRFRTLTNAAVDAQQRSTLVGSGNGLIVGLVGALGTGAILWIGANRVLDGRLSIGSLLVFLAYLGTLQGQLRSLAGIYTALQGVGGSADRVMEVLDVPPEVADRPGATSLRAVRGHVRFEDVTFGYEPDRPVLCGISLEARPGEMVAIVGATGAGKTTLVSLVPRFFDPWHGRVTLDGRDVRDIRLRSLREQIALVPQEAFLFPLSVAENIAYGRPGASRAEIEAAARAANADDFIERLPEGYETVIGERGATLSGGQRQRLAIARALLCDAPILILDEPTSALDAETEASVLQALERLMAGRTTLVIAHRLSTVRRADRIVVLHDGQAVEEGTHVELLSRRALYAHLHDLQAGQGHVHIGSAN